MRVKVLIGAQGEAPAAREPLDIWCGRGNQLLQWLGHAACARLAHKRGEALGCYVPQAVLDKDGRALDIDLVLSEAVVDGGELAVEYGPGPTAFRARWDGRPRTPPFAWSDAAGSEAPAPPDAWLAGLDPAREGLGALQEPEFLATGLGAGEADLERVKELLVAHAGALQALFLMGTCDAASSPDATAHMTLAQLKALLALAKVVGHGGVPADSLDRVFATVLATPRALARKAENTGAAASALDLADFFVVMVHVAHLRFAAESFAASGASSAAPLSTKLLSLLQEGLGATVLSDLSRRLEGIAAGALTPGALLLLRKGRSLTEQVLDRCQLKRVKARSLRVDLRHVAKHLARWGLLGKEFGMPELATIAVFAKQTATDPGRFALHPWPLALDYGEFERLLLGAAHALARARRGRAAGPFEEFLGEFLDAVYKRAGVLVEGPGGGGGGDLSGGACGGGGGGGQQAAAAAVVGARSAAGSSSGGAEAAAKG